MKPTTFTLIASAALSSAATLARAQTDGSLLFKPWEPNQVVEAKGSAYVFHSTGVSGGGPDTTFTEVRSSGRFRVDPDMQLSPTIGYQSTDLLVGNAFQSVPRHLTDSSVAFGSPITKIGDKGFLAASGAIGYAGDDPLGTARAWYAKAAVFAGVEIDEHHAFLVWVDYDGNRDLFPDVPLPGFAYAFDFSPSLSFVLGFPVDSVTWKPTDHLTLTLDVDLPDSVDARATYAFNKHWSAFAAYDTSVDSFHVRDVPNNGRLFFNEQRAELGLKWRPAPFAELTTAAGYAFARSFETGFDVRDTRRVGDLDDAPYLRLGLSLQF